MSEKPKRVLTDEQKKKMLEGRRRKAEERKLQKEKDKENKDLDKIKAKELKEINKKLELEAIQQQKDRIELLNVSKRKKSEMRGKLRFCKNNPQAIEDMEQLLSEIENKENTKKNIDLEIKEIKVEMESKKHELSKDEENEVYKRVFEKEALKIEKSLPIECREVFRSETNKFDFNLNLSDNINSMISNIENTIKKNTNITDSVNKTIMKTEEQINQRKEITDIQLKKEKEKRIQAKLQSLYSLR